MIRFILAVVITLIARPVYADYDVHQAMAVAWYDQLVAQFPDKLLPRTLHIQSKPPARLEEVSTIRPPILLALGETPYPHQLKEAWDRLLEERFRKKPYKDHSALVDMTDPLANFTLRAATITGVEPEPEPPSLNWGQFWKRLW